MAQPSPTAAPPSRRRHGRPAMRLASGLAAFQDDVLHAAAADPEAATGAAAILGALGRSLEAQPHVWLVTLGLALALLGLAMPLFSDGRVGRG